MDGGQGRHPTLSPGSHDGQLPDDGKARKDVRLASETVTENTRENRDSKRGKDDSEKDQKDGLSGVECRHGRKTSLSPGNPDQMPSRPEREENTQHVPDSVSSSQTARKPDAGGGKSESGKDKPQQCVSPLRQSAELSFLQDLKSKHKFSLAFDHQNKVADIGRSFC